MTPSPQQGDALRRIRSWWNQGHPTSPLFYLGGFAGSGKSFLIPFILSELGLDPREKVEVETLGRNTLDIRSDYGHTVLFVAPTGKAALVISRKLQAQGIARRATTIHKALYVPTRGAEDEGPGQEDGEDGEDGTGATDLVPAAFAPPSALNYSEAQDPEFALRPSVDAIAAKLIIVDEASMVSGKIAEDLLAFGKPILAIGDPGQLPPIEPGALIANRAPDAFLSEIQRQALDSPIIGLATHIRQGGRIGAGAASPCGSVIIRSRMELPGFIGTLAPTDLASGDLRMICGTHRTRWSLTEMLRTHAGFAGALPAPGEPLICMRNSLHPGRGLVNGQEALLRSIRPAVRAPSVLLCELDVVDETGTSRPIEIPLHRIHFDEHAFRKRLGRPDRTGTGKFRLQMLERFDWGWIITAHKGQGSEWPGGIVVDESRAFREARTQWLYTAVTRFKDRLAVFV